MDDFDDYEPEEEQAETYPRDPKIDEAKISLRQLFRERQNEVFYGRQLEVHFEATFIRYSDSMFTRALGHHGEMMFDAALPTEGFLPKAKKVRAYAGREWLLTPHDLDRVYERDGIAYGAEIKKTRLTTFREPNLISSFGCALGLHFGRSSSSGWLRKATSRLFVGRAGSRWFSSINSIRMDKQISLSSCASAWACPLIPLLPSKRAQSSAS